MFGYGTIKPFILIWNSGAKEIEMAPISLEEKQEIEDIFADLEDNEPKEQIAQVAQDMSLATNTPIRTCKEVIETAIKSEPPKQEVVPNPIPEEDMPVKFDYKHEDKDAIKWFFVNVERFSTGDDWTFQPFIDFTILLLTTKLLPQ